MTTIIQLLKSRTVFFAVLLAVLSVVQGYIGLLPRTPIQQMYVGIGISVVITVLHIVTFGRARPGETISAAAWGLESDGKWQGRLLRPLIDGLFYFVQKDHCAQAWQWQRHLYKKE